MSLAFTAARAVTATTLEQLSLRHLGGSLRLLGEGIDLLRLPFLKLTAPFLVGSGAKVVPELVTCCLDHRLRLWIELGSKETTLVLESCPAHVGREREARRLDPGVMLQFSREATAGVGPPRSSSISRPESCSAEAVGMACSAV